MDQPEKFWCLTATGWTAIGSMVSALSILVLSVFNYFYLRAARKQANAAQQTLKLLDEQLVMSEQPFVAIHSKYDNESDVLMIHAVSQGSGPALDVEAHLTFAPGAESGQAEYGIGCLAVEEKFLFLIGKDSGKLTSVTLRYRSISGRCWRTSVQLIGGHPVITAVAPDEDEPTTMELAFGHVKQKRPIERAAPE